MQDLAEFTALGSLLEQQADPQLVAAGQGVVGGAQGAVEIQGATPLAALLALVHRLAQLIDALAPLIEQLHPDLVTLLQRPAQLPLAANHQIEAAAVALVEQGVTGEGGDGVVRRPQHQRLGPTEPAGGVDLRQQQGQQQQRGQHGEQHGGQSGHPG